MLASYMLRSTRLASCSISFRAGVSLHRHTRRHFSQDLKSERDEDWAKNGLSGKKISIKDNIVTADLPTTASSNILDSWKSPYQATVVKLLQHHGAHVTSKTELDEFGMGSHTQTAAGGALKSPYSRKGVALSPGGSSGGSAIAVAQNQCWAALGTDTGGSVRLPAAYLGVVGFKPSYGLLSRWGVIQYANSLDTVGILSRQVAAASQLFLALNVFDAKDPSSLPSASRARLAQTTTPRRALLRIGVPSEYNIAELSPLVRATWVKTLSALESKGHTLHQVSLPTTRQALSAYYVLAPAEASSNLAKYDGIRYGRRAVAFGDKQTLPLYARARAAGFGDEVKRRILLGAYSLSSEAIDNYFIQAQKVRRMVQLDFDKVFSSSHPLLPDGGKDDSTGVDVLIAPTAPTLPPTIDEVKRQAPLEQYMNDVFTVPASLAGLPALSIPVSLTEQHASSVDSSDMHKVGIQIIGQYGADDQVLSCGMLIEELEKDAG